MAHRSGSPAEWQKRRQAYQAQSGAVSNPGDGRMRAKERRRSAVANARALLATHQPTKEA